MQYTAYRLDTCITWTSVSLHIDSGNVFFHFETREEDARHSAWRRFLTLSIGEKAMEKK